jgi:type IV secretory pathway VirB6-like protein
MDILTIGYKEKSSMEKNVLRLSINKTPIHNIIKGNLVQYSNKTLYSTIIDTLSIHITETIESLLNRQLKDLCKVNN